MKIAVRHAGILSVVVLMLLGKLTTASENLITNGTFDTSVPSNGTGGAWTSTHIDGAGGHRSTGGNPNGMFILNDAGSGVTDPTISQMLTGLIIGAVYVVKGEYSNVYGCCGSTAPLSFGLLLDGQPILQLHGAPTNTFIPFETSFTATSGNHTIALAAERNGSDWEAKVDNVSVTLSQVTAVARTSWGRIKALYR